MRFLCRTPRNGSIIRRPNLQTDANQNQHQHPHNNHQRVVTSSSNINPNRRQEMATSTSTSNQVHHDSIAHKFTLDLGNNKQAHIDYKPIGLHKIEMYHTEVPRDLRGQGIGKRLARGALELLAAEGGIETQKIKLTCSYLIGQLDKFADDNLKRMVVIDK